MTTKKAKTIELFPGSRKTARATATIKPGVGKVRINGVPVEIFTPLIARNRILTPLIFAGPMRDTVDLLVEVKGGGFMGQAEASAMAITRAIASFTRDGGFKRDITEFDKHLLVGDPRRTEPKKFGGPGPRRRKQKSYR